MSMASSTAEVLERKARSAPAIDLHVRDEWMPHRELAALQSSPLTECSGSVRVDSIADGRVEASCDGCMFVVTATLDQVARSLQTRPEKWWQR